ncbi:MAG: hypothetical protein LBT97_01355, partial [Planctomycetota bacterium]|nr:hypothetical protein [Planctomycetota bacterium]
MAAMRERKLSFLKKKMDDYNSYLLSYLLDHPRAKADLAVRREEARVKKLGMDAYCQVELSGRTLS